MDLLKTIHGVVLLLIFLHTTFDPFSILIQHNHIDAQFLHPFLTDLILIEMDKIRPCCIGTDVGIGKYNVVGVLLGFVADYCEG